MRRLKKIIKFEVYVGIKFKSINFEQSAHVCKFVSLFILSLSVEGLQTIKLEILEEILIKSWFKNIYNEDCY
jgi:hypothetical protein